MLDFSQAMTAGAFVTLRATIPGTHAIWESRREGRSCRRRGKWGVASFLGFVSPGFVGFFWSLLLLNACHRYPPLEKSYEHCIKAMKARSVHSIVPSS